MSKQDASVSDLNLGIAAEHIVCADLILLGFNAYLTGAGCAYDIAVDTGRGLIRVQVKATAHRRPIPQRTTHTPTYGWAVRRAGKGGKRLYGKTEFDVLALVAVDIRAIAYIAVTDRVLQTIHLRAPGSPITSKQKIRKNIDQYPFSDAVKEHFNG